jgi:MOSC domain-containing protein YiiM
MFEGEVLSIHIAPDEGDATHAVNEIRAVAGRGLEGDRYFNHSGKFSHNENPGREVTLIESEAIDALGRDYGIRLELGDSRRNIVTRGVPLNHLVGREFKVGSTVVLEGVRLCDPCGYLEGLTVSGVKKGLAHRGGLNARIVSEGTIRRGDPITLTD